MWSYKNVLHREMRVVPAGARLQDYNCTASREFSKSIALILRKLYSIDCRKNGCLEHRVVLVKYATEEPSAMCMNGLNRPSSGWPVSDYVVTKN